MKWEGTNYTYLVKNLECRGPVHASGPVYMEVGDPR